MRNQTFSLQHGQRCTRVKHVRSYKAIRVSYLQQSGHLYERNPLINTKIKVVDVHIVQLLTRRKIYRGTFLVQK
jgi:hypothetical protein